MIEQLVDRVWTNPDLHRLMRRLETAWLRRELGLELMDELELPTAAKSMQIAAILACSTDRTHRESAFRLATSVFDLYGTEQLPLDQALRVVLARLGNFPSFSTRAAVADAVGKMPLSMVIEELLASRPRTVDIVGNSVVLTDFQHELWKALTGGSSIAVTAPTSAGKSFVLQQYIISLFDHELPCSVLYLVPTRALISQVADNILGALRRSKMERSPEVITVPLEESVQIPDRAVWVLTQERAQLMHANHADFRLDTVIVDEAQGISDGARGVLLQSVLDEIIDRNSEVQILFASPAIANPEIFGRVFSIPNLAKLQSAEKTVAQNFVQVKVLSARGGRIEISLLDQNTMSISPIAEISIGHTLASRIEKLVHISMRLAADQSSLIFANGPAEAENIALQIGALKEISEPSDFNRALAEVISESVHPKFVLVDCVLRGTAFHYANIPPIVRGAVEKAFSNGSLSMLACTSTLLQGVNLPAKSLFMLSPQKGEAGPLKSIDFWNLSGRAGRLQREFQGNIFLIDYEEWSEKPLAGPSASEIKPAIEEGLSGYPEELIAVISNEPAQAVGNVQSLLESLFVKLLSEKRINRLDVALSRAGLAPNADLRRTLTEAVEKADRKISLPLSVLKRSPHISAHKQQNLYQELREAIAAGGVESARILLPAHPRESRAFESYCDILEMCHIVLLENTKKSNIHRFQALISRKWMTGTPLPVIIEEQVRREPGKSVRTVIRNTLDVIEEQVRFRVVGLFTTYIAILEHALQEAGMEDLIADIPPIPLYLEVGASDQTMVSLISLGLSRVTAMRLNEAAPRKDFGVEAVRTWLSGARIETLGLSRLLEDEVRSLLQAR